jgi:hypothetical protein
MEIAFSKKQLAIFSIWLVATCSVTLYCTCSLLEQLFFVFTSQTFSVFTFQQQEEEVDEVYKEFVASFEDAGKHHNKTWVKGGVVNPDKPHGKQWFDAKNYCWCSFPYVVQPLLGLDIGMECCHAPRKCSILSEALKIQYLSWRLRTWIRGAYGRAQTQKVHSWSGHY